MNLSRIIIFVVGLLGTLITFGQPQRYQQTVFQDSDTLKNVEYANAYWLNNPLPLLANYNIHEGENHVVNKPLLMDIFLPREDTLKKRPAIIFAHSGAFLIGSRLADDMVAFCDSFARRGYVTATIDYRLGMGARVTRFFGIIVGLSFPESTGYRALYRATQDGRAAVRYLKQNAENLGIDTTKIFMVGSSAGALLTLYNQYLNTPAEIPPDALTEPSLGDLDSVGARGFGAQANAYVSMWGAVEDTKLIENIRTPGFLIHGMNDDVVPFKKGKPMDGMIGAELPINFSMPETYGSFCIDTALTNRGIQHETFFVEGKKHEFYGVDTGEFSEDGPNQYWDTIHGKISSFFYEMIKPEAKFIFEQKGLTADFQNISPNIIYSEWRIENQIYTGNEVTHTFPGEGDFEVKLKTCNQNLACDSLTKIISARISVEALTEKQQIFTVYPNPFSTHINIEGINKPFNLKIYDVTGRLQISKTGFNQQSFQVSGLKKGLYILKIEIGSDTFFRKIVKE